MLDTRGVISQRFLRHTCGDLAIWDVPKQQALGSVMQALRLLVWSETRQFTRYKDIPDMASNDLGAGGRLK